MEFKVSSNRYLTHYSVTPTSVAYEKFCVMFDLELDANPDFGQDKIQPTDSNKEIKKLRVSIASETDHRMHFKIIDSDETRWEVPLESQDKPKDDQDFLLSFQRLHLNNTGLSFSRERFGLSLGDRDAPENVIFTTEEGYFRYMQKYLVIEFLLTSDKVFGLGERLANMNLREGSYTLFNRDQGAIIETGTNPGHNLYGTQPFLLYQLTTGRFAGLFFKTSNALQVDLKRNAVGTSVRYSTIGGIMDFYIFYKGDAEFIVEQYHALVGRPVLPPFWSLGYHYGRAGITSLKELKEMVDDFITKRIPLDAVWLDTGILEDGKNFELDKTRFGEIKKYVEEMRNKHDIHFISVLEPGLKKDSKYFSKMELVKNPDKSTFIGKAHVGDVGFPNFWKKDANEVWKTAVQNFLAETGIDGLWLNLNEFSQLCDGNCNGATSNNYPFIPGETPLEKNTLPMDAMYESDDEQQAKFLTEFNVHSLNPLLMANATFQAFSNSPNRTFLATRSSYPGIQQFASAHWLGETVSNWEQLGYSLPSVIDFSMYGLPLVGASICGFNTMEDSELCNRWAQIGLLYPLSLDYKANSKHKDREKRSMRIMVNAIKAKYSILRYIYTTMYEQSLYGGLVARPVFFEFPDDRMAFRTMDRTFLYGKHLLVTSPLEGYQKTYSIYFPNANWYRFPTGEPVYKYKKRSAEGSIIQADVETEGPNLFIRGGGIIPYQNVMDMAVSSMKELSETPTTLIIALDENDEASGRMVVDDGISKNGKHRHYSFTFRKNVLTVMLLEGYDSPESFTLAESFVEIKILGAGALKDITSVYSLSSTMMRRRPAFSYDEKTEIFTITENGRKKFSWSTIESISLFTDKDYDTCTSEFEVKNLKVTDQLRRLSATLLYENEEVKKTFTMNAILMNDYILNLRIKPDGYNAWEVPEIINETERNMTKGLKSFPEYLFGLASDDFSFIISKPSDPEDIIIAADYLYLDDQFINLQVELNATQIYGLGERTSPDFILYPGVYTLYARDEANSIEDGIPSGKNLYGSHPFYMFRMHDGTYGGVFLLNSNAMDIIIQRPDSISYQVDHIAAGGIIDMFIIQSGPPKLIIQQYHSLIGKPHLQPYWAFGNHQARHGYNSQEKLEKVIEGYEKEKIPLDALWIGIDYMDSLNPFTLDKTRYPSMKNFVDSLHSKDIKFVPIIEAGIPINSSNIAYKKGLDRNLFLKDETNKASKYNHVLGMTWAGYSTFIDFVNPEANDYWIEMLNYMRSDFFDFDGIWLDMNEVTNFCDGECNLEGSHKKPWEMMNPKFSRMQYIPGHRYIERKSLPVTVQYNTTYGNFTEYNAHSLYGHYQMKATNSYFTKQGKRPFIISRSTFPGSGRYGSHWLGNNKSKWEFLAYSIIGIYNFHMFGIPFTGADVCGFSGDSSVELCQRWYQLAAFYPFCRNHNDFNTRNQEPYSDPKLASTARSALALRYSLIRYLYSLHMDVSINGGTYFMPLSFEFMDDIETLNRTQHSFMLGSALKVTPVLEQGVSKVISYFPNSNWYSLETGKKVTEFKAGVKKGMNLSLDADFNKINVHICGGRIIPIQKAENAMKTSDLKKIRTGFVIAPDHTNQARGFVIFDDEMSLDTIVHDTFRWISVTYISGKISFDKTQGNYELNKENDEGLLGEVNVYNAKEYAKGKNALATLKSGNTMKMDIKYDSTFEVLKLSSEEKIPLNELTTITWEK